MRLAVLADVHGNLRALEAVLRDAERRGADGVVHLGDLVGGAADGPVIRRIEAEGIPGVAGDWDLAALAAGAAEGTTELFAFLRRLPAHMSITEGSTRFVLAHASPERPDDGSLPDLPDEALGRLLASWGADVLLVGHTHRALARRVGERLLLNPGSVAPGAGDPRPSYLLVDTTGGLEVAHVRAQIGVESGRG